MPIYHIVPATMRPIAKSSRMRGMRGMVGDYARKDARKGKEMTGTMNDN